MKSYNNLYRVPVVFPGVINKETKLAVHHVNVRRMPSNTARQADAKVPVRMVVVDGIVFAVSVQSSENWTDGSLTLFASNLRLNNTSLTRDSDDAYAPSTFKLGATFSRLVVKAIHLLGGLTTKQYRESQTLLADLAEKERAEEDVRRGEDQLFDLLDDGLITAQHAKKLIDKRVREIKERTKGADALASKSAPIIIQPLGTL